MEVVLYDVVESGLCLRRPAPGKAFWDRTAMNASQMACKARRTSERGNTVRTYSGIGSSGDVDVVDVLLQGGVVV